MVSRLLRHTAGERGLAMSADGWSAIADVLSLLELTRSKLDAAVRDHLLWHGTNRQALPAIQREGLKPGRRTHVHLAPSKDSQVGRRSAVDVLLGVDPGNLAVYRAPNGVLLTREVPPDAIVEADAVHRAGWSDG